jgi:monoamine oxidase
MEPDWYSARTFWLKDIDLPEERPFRELDKYFVPFLKGSSPLQESHVVKQLFLDIAQYGLNYAYREWKDGRMVNPDPNWKYTKTSNPKKVLIVGAGMSGLCAGYELSQAGHQVEILEIKDRVGGRVETVRDPFTGGLYAEAGAMRIPGSPEEVTSLEGPCTLHFLTDFYAYARFKLTPERFVNYCDKCFLSLPGHEKVTLEEWSRNSAGVIRKLWPEWDKTLSEDVKKKFGISDIKSYFKASLHPLIEVLRRRTEEGRKTSNGCGQAWVQWLEMWSGMSVESFLRSNPSTDLRSKFSDSDGDLLEQLCLLLPWPDDAVAARSACGSPYSWNVSVTFVTIYMINGFWSNAMHTYRGGLQSFSEKFLEKNEYGWNEDVELLRNVKFGVDVQKIEYNDNLVIVTAYNIREEKEIRFTGDAVIVTVPIFSLNQIKFIPPLPKELPDAISAASPISPMKVLIQCKTRFWGKLGIDGGCSTIVRPEGSLAIVYPSSSKTDKQKGILMVSYWGNKLSGHFANMPKEDAVKELMEEISLIHPEITSEHEHITVHVFLNQFVEKLPSSQNVQQLTSTNIGNKVYFGGDGLSWVQYWMEGALESGLRAAFQFYCHNEC